MKRIDPDIGLLGPRWDAFWDHLSDERSSVGRPPSRKARVVIALVGTVGGFLGSLIIGRIG